MRNHMALNHSQVNPSGFTRAVEAPDASLVGRVDHATDAELANVAAPYPRYGKQECKTCLIDRPMIVMNRRTNQRAPIRISASGVGASAGDTGFAATPCGARKAASTAAGAWSEHGSAREKEYTRVYISHIHKCERV